MLSTVHRPQISMYLIKTSRILMVRNGSRPSDFSIGTFTITVIAAARLGVASDSVQAQKGYICTLQGNV